MISPSWHDAGLYTEGCTAFNSDGWLKNSTGVKPNAQPKCDLYTVVDGPPASYHYLRMAEQDADQEDLRHVGGSVASMQAACSNDTACAGFNSHGWLKSSVKIISSSSVDLYVKLGGIAHPTPPPTPIPPTPPPAPGPWHAPIWPLPMSAANGSLTITVAAPLPGKPLFQMVATTSSKARSCSTLTEAFARYTKLTMPHAVDPTAERTTSGDASEGGNKKQATLSMHMVLPHVSVAVQSLDEAPPQLDTDESYSLDIPSDGTPATLTVGTVQSLHLPCVLLLLLLLLLLSPYCRSAYIDFMLPLTHPCCPGQYDLRRPPRARDLLAARPLRL
jgi:hypothetical protein